MRPIFVLVYTSIFFWCSISAVLAENTVVIPLHVKSKLSNIVTVAKNGGDFTDPAAAINSVSNAAVDNKYLVYIAPGRYVISEPIIMKKFVSIQGSGSSLTLIEGGACSDEQVTSALIIAAENTLISDLAILNMGFSTFCTGIVADDVQSLKIKNTSIMVDDALTNRGIYLRNSDAKISNTSIWSGGAGSPSGVHAVGSSLSLNEVSIQVLGFGSNGIYFDSLATSKGFSIFQSSISGSTNGIRSINGNVFIRFSALLGGVDLTGGSISCICTHDGVSPLDSNCN